VFGRHSLESFAHANAFKHQPTIRPRITSYTQDLHKYTTYTILHTCVLEIEFHELEDHPNRHMLVRNDTKADSSTSKGVRVSHSLCSFTRPVSPHHDQIPS
jgi:hypothetical protein